MERNAAATYMRRSMRGKRSNSVCGGDGEGTAMAVKKVVGCGKGNHSLCGNLE